MAAVTSGSIIGTTWRNYTEGSNTYYSNGQLNWSLDAQNPPTDEYPYGSNLIKYTLILLNKKSPSPTASNWGSGYVRGVYGYKIYVDDETPPAAIKSLGPSSSVKQNYSANKTIVTGSYVIPADSDGNCTLYIQFDTWIGGAGSGQKTSNSGTYELPQIPQPKDPLVNIKRAGTWTIGKGWANVSGTWKQAKEIWIKANGVWKPTKLRG